MAHKKKEKVGFIAPTPKDIKPLTQDDGQKIKEMIDLNNTFAAMENQMKQFDSAIQMISKKRDMIAKGEINLPVMIQITRTMSHAENNKEKVLKHLDDEIIQIKMAKQGVVGSFEHRKDEYAECVSRVYKILGDKIPKVEITQIKGMRPSSQAVKEAEQAALEKEFDKLIAVKPNVIAKKE